MPRLTPVLQQSIVWCMIPFPTFPLPAAPEPAGRLRAATITAEASPWPELGGALRNVFDFELLWDAIRAWLKSLTDVAPSWPGNDDGGGLPPEPGHGSSRVAMDFWFFLFVYYGFYNLVGLLWITKVFNMYGLNWWPVRLGFPVRFPSGLLGNRGKADAGGMRPRRRLRCSTVCRWPAAPSSTTISRDR